MGSSDAVGVFRVAVELNLKRRDNDKKIDALFIEMRNMMQTLVQYVYSYTSISGARSYTCRLRDIKNLENVGPDSRTIKGRIQELVEQIAQDIKTCANFCDTYTKKTPIVKIIQGSLWDKEFKRFIDLFATRRKELDAALSDHIGVAIDDTNQKLREINAKIDRLTDSLLTIVSPEQQELTELISKEGGVRAVMTDNTALEELLKSWPAIALDQAKGGSGRDDAERSSRMGGDVLVAVKLELFDTPEISIQRNREVFERKFNLQSQALIEDAGGMARHEGDRDVPSVRASLYDGILDPVR